MNARAERFPFLDAMRAIAALSVLVYHASFFGALSGPDTGVTRYTRHLDVGVTIFFLISGFLLYRPFVQARFGDDRMPRVAAYGWRRFLRIVPPYWVALTLVTLWLSVPHVFNTSDAPVYYGFGQIYSATHSIGGISQAWTLCVEVSFYVFLPLWALLLRRAGGGASRRRALTIELAALAGLFVLSTAYQIWAVHHIAPGDLRSPPYLMPLPNFLDQFAVGMALAVLSVWYDASSPPSLVRFVQRWPIIPWACALVGLWVVSTRVGYGGSFAQRPSRSAFLEQHELYTLIALGMLLPAIVALSPRGVVTRVLASRPLRFIGLVSYSFYLYHLAVVEQLHRWFGKSVHGGFAAHFMVYLAGGLIGTTAIATLSYFFVERPALRLKRLVPTSAPMATREALAEPAGPAPSAVGPRR